MAGLTIGLTTGRASADYIHLYQGNAALLAELGNHPENLCRHPLRAGNTSSGHRNN
jgi:hypothetical protein